MSVMLMQLNSPYGPCVYNELANKKRAIDELN